MIPPNPSLFRRWRSHLSLLPTPVNIFHYISLSYSFLLCCFRPLFPSPFFHFCFLPAPLSSTISLSTSWPLLGAAASPPSLHPGCADDSRALMASVCCSPACLCVISSSPALLHTLSPRLSAPFFSQTAAQLPRCQLTVAVNSHTILCIAKADCVWRASN